MKNHNILIIDDEQEVGILLKSFLNRKGQQVNYSYTLKEGLEQFQESIPDILILDHNLPDGQGIEYIQNFKQLNRFLKIIVISAMSNLKASAIENGADYFLEKPISFNTLIAVLEKY
jgi:DNA-binding response OmpR family regulator